MKPYSVYLDTDILIKGSKKEEHSKIKEMSKRGEIRLYISDLNKIEQHGKVFPKLRKKDAILCLYDDLELATMENRKLAEKLIIYRKKCIREYEQERKNEEAERNFWKDVNLFPISLKSQFETLYFISGVSPSYSSYIKNDLNYLDELVVKYNIDGKDAIHVMNAHSANTDYLLTWDDKLVKKAKKISWLKSKVFTPERFLAKE